MMRPCWDVVELSQLSGMHTYVELRLILRTVHSIFFAAILGSSLIHSKKTLSTPPEQKMVLPTYAPSAAVFISSQLANSSILCRF